MPNTIGDFPLILLPKPDNLAQRTLPSPTKMIQKTAVWVRCIARLGVTLEGSREPPVPRGLLRDLEQATTPGVSVSDARQLQLSRGLHNPVRRHYQVTGMLGRGDGLGQAGP